MNALTSTSEVAFKLGDTGERSGLFGVVERVKRYCGNFRFLSGRKWIARQSLFVSFTFAFDRPTTANYHSRGGITKRWSGDRHDFYFRSRYFRFRPGDKPRVFQVNIRADSCLGPTLPGSRAEYHPCKLGLTDYFRSGYFRFQWVQGGLCPGPTEKSAY